MKHHIVAIGVSRHQHPFVNNLAHAAKDAQEFFNLFIQNMADVGSQNLLVDSEATLAQIRTALGTELQEQLQPDDAFFFFYSGHGSTSENTDNSSLAHFLLPFDATPDITNSAISFLYLKETFDKLPCKAKFVFIDSCFSGAINAKGYTKASKKEFKEVKTLTNTVSGKGYLIFSASKEDETAIEDPEYQNGLFTYFLLGELQKDRKEDKFPVVEIFTPITEQVTKRAKEKYGHTQTPTLSSHLEGNVFLPRFTKRIKLSPSVLEVPRYPELAQAAFPIPEIQLDDKQQEKLINDIIGLVVRARQQQEPVSEIAFERFCAKLARKLREDWEKIFTETGGDVSEIPISVAKLEAAAFQFTLLGAVVAVFGSDKQMEVYGENAVEILGWGRHRAGLMALIAAPQIIVVEIIYIVGVLCLARNHLKPFDVLLKTPVYDVDYRDRPPCPLLLERHIHYCRALGGSSTTVNDHIRKILESFGWLAELAPKLGAEVGDFQRQVNFLLVMLTVHSKDYLWPDCARWDSLRVRPLVNRIKYDPKLKKQLGEMFGTKEDKTRQIFMKYLSEIKSRGLGHEYWWESIGPEDLLTEEERRAEEEKRKQQAETP